MKEGSRSQTYPCDEGRLPTVRPTRVMKEGCRQSDLRTRVMKGGYRQSDLPV